MVDFVAWLLRASNKMPLPLLHLLAVLDALSASTRLGRGILLDALSFLFEQ